MLKQKYNFSHISGDYVYKFQSFCISINSDVGNSDYVLLQITVDIAILFMSR